MHGERVPVCLTIAASDSAGGAGVQADLRAFAAAGCHGASVITALTAQNTTGIIATHDVPASFIDAQLRAVFDDISVDAVKTGALRTLAAVETVAAALSILSSPLVIDPVMAASAGGALNSPDVVDAIVRLLFPRATVVTPNLPEAEVLAGSSGSRAALAERIAARGARAVLITGGHGDPVDHLFAGGSHIAIAVQRHAVAATHGSGCTHSATVAAELAKGSNLETAARRAAAVTATAVARGLTGIGRGEGLVDVLDLRSRLS